MTSHRGSRLVRLSALAGLLSLLWFPVLFNLPRSVARALDDWWPRLDWLMPLDRALLWTSLLIPLAGIILGLVAARRGMRFARLAVAFSVGTLLLNSQLPFLQRTCCVSNEGGTIGDLRTIVSAQAVYQSANGGLYGEPECLSVPTTCISGYPATAPTFLDAHLFAGERRGYRWRFHAGPATTVTGGVETDPSPGRTYRGLERYAVTAVPTQPGDTGFRGFCGDASGIICVTPDGSEPPVTGGACPAGCTALR
jgi:hypothetical protein